jgi:hypothetical protein
LAPERKFSTGFLVSRQVRHTLKSSLSIFPRLFRPSKGLTNALHSDRGLLSCRSYVVNMIESMSQSLMRSFDSFDPSAGQRDKLFGLETRRYPTSRILMRARTLQLFDSGANLGGADE